MRKFSSPNQPVPPQHNQPASLLTLDGTSNEITVASTTNQFDTDQETAVTRQSRGASTANNSTSSNVSNNSSSNSTVIKSRRFANSTERTMTSGGVSGSSSASSTTATRNSSATRSKKTIEKSDISCPFRCSCVDLSGNGFADTPVDAPAGQQPSMTSVGEIQPKNSTEMIKVILFFPSPIFKFNPNLTLSHLRNTQLW